MRRVALRRSVPAAAGHSHDVGSVLERLGKVADSAHDIDVPLHGQWENGDPAKGEPWVALDDVACHVAAVVTLADHALVAIDLFPEGVLAAHEEEEHGGGREAGAAGRLEEVVVFWGRKVSRAMRRVVGDGLCRKSIAKGGGAIRRAGRRCRMSRSG